MNKFSTWSDEKINEEITRLEHNCGGWGVSPCGKFLFLSGDGRYEYFTQPIHDYCNNWGGMGPLIEANGICICPDLSKPSEWIADKSIEFYSRVERIANARNTKPLRAAAEVYLMIKENLK